MMSDAQPVAALILAGRRSVGAPDSVAAAGGQPVKALVRINGRSMIERVIATLRESGAVNEISLCLPDDLDVTTCAPDLAGEFAAGTLQRVSAAGSPSASVRAFVAPRVGKQAVLITTADHPLLTVEMVNAFLRTFRSSGAEAAAALADAAAIGARYPQSRRTRLAFADGAFTGCNLFGFAGEGSLRVLDFWRRVEQHRKQPWKIAHALGWSTLVFYLVGRLTLAQMCERLGHRAGSRLQAVILGDPHAGIDVDTPDDLRLVTAIIEDREKPGVSAG